MTAPRGRPTADPAAGRRAGAGPANLRTPGANDPADGELFERFRRHADLDALGALFDRTAPALLRLALHLARDPAHAEDLLQATFVKAIEDRGRWDRTRPLLPWLLGILGHLHQQQRWRLGRRPDPDRLTKPRQASPFEAASARELGNAVENAIDALPAPFRPVLRLHLGYGHTPAEIAHALARPPGTVRSQLARGLARLRRLLPAGLATGVALAALAPGRGLAAVRRAVLGHPAASTAASTAASVAASTAASTAAPTALVLGTFTMKKLALPALLVALLAGAFAMWPRPEPGAPQSLPGTGPPAPASASLAADRETGSTHAGTAAPARSVVPTAPPPTTGSLLVRVRFHPDEPAPDVGVRIRGAPPSAWPSPEWTRRTDAHGECLLEGMPPGTFRLAADRGGRCEASVGPGATTVADLTIPAGVQVRGIVVDGHGRPLPAARVWISSGEAFRWHGTETLGVAADGTFALRDVADGRWIGALCPGRLRSPLQQIRRPDGPTRELRIVLDRAGCSLAGRVFDPDGRPAADARVFVGADSGAVPTSEAIMAGFRPPFDLRTDQAGRFRADGLPPGPTRVHARAAGAALRLSTVELPDAGETSVDVHLQRGATVTGRVRGVENADLAATLVEVMTAPLWDLDHLESYAGPPWAGSQVRPAADGSFRIENVQPGCTLLWAELPARQLGARLRTVLADGQTFVWEPDLLAAGDIAGTVVDSRHRPLGGLRVCVEGTGFDGGRQTAVTGDDGRFRFRRLAARPCRLRVFAHERLEPQLPAATRHGVRPGTEDLVVVVADAELPSGGLRGTVVAAAGGAPAGRALVCWWRCDRPTPAFDRTDDNGAFRIGPLPPGRYRLRAIAGDSRTPWSDPHELAAGQHLDLGALPLPLPGTVALTANTADGRPLEGASVSSVEDVASRERIWFAGRLDRGALTLPLAPGDYRLRIAGEGLPVTNVPVSVTAGATTTVHVAVPRGVARAFQLAPPTAGMPIDVTFRWTRDGASLQEYTSTLGESDLRGTWTLAPGAYELTCTDENGRTAATAFAVGAGDGLLPPIAVRLP